MLQPNSRRPRAMLALGRASLRRNASHWKALSPALFENRISSRSKWLPLAAATPPLRHFRLRKAKQTRMLHWRRARRTQDQNTIQTQGRPLFSTKTLEVKANFHPGGEQVSDRADPSHLPPGWTNVTRRYTFNTLPSTRAPRGSRTNL